MENKVTLTADKLVVIPQGLTKITALKTKIAVPLAHVLGASIDNGILKESKGLRLPGTAVPGYWTGSFFKDGEESFFNVKMSDQAVVIQLKDEKYTRLILGVANPTELVNAINNQLD
ncbi:MAG: PH domain-containing protein [Lactobacillus sp.]